MAYCQSQLYVDYLKSKHGANSIGEMLAAYRDGLDTAAAISKVCKVDKAAFEKGYRAYLDEVVKTIQGGPVEKPMTYRQLVKAHEEEPDNLDVSARLAEQCRIRGQKEEARKLVDAVLAKKSTHPLASYVKAVLKEAAGETEEAQKLLEAAVDRDAPEPKVVMALGKLYFEKNEFDKAAQQYELGHKAEPYETKWLVELAKVYNRSNDETQLIEVLKKLVLTDADEFEQRKHLAQLLLKKGRLKEAEQYAREALEVNFKDEETQKMLEDALEKQSKMDEATKLRELLKK
jgi:tetratricopeptide (TPR) repeat protein